MDDYTAVYCLVCEAQTFGKEVDGWIGVEEFDNGAAFGICSHCEGASFSNYLKRVVRRAKRYVEDSKDDSFSDNFHTDQELNEIEYFTLLKVAHAYRLLRNG